MLNYRFRRTSLPHEELRIVLENIIIDKVTTHPASKVKKLDTSAPMEIGMAAGADGEETFEEGFGKHLNLQREQGNRRQILLERRKGHQLERSEVLQQQQR